MFRLIILCLSLTVVYSNDLQEGKDGGRKIFEEKFYAHPAIWTQVQNVTVNATNNEVISRINVTDLREHKDGEAKIVEGGLGEENVTIELKSPTILRGFEFQVEVYAVPGRKSRDTTVLMMNEKGAVIYNGTDVITLNQTDANLNHDTVEINDDLTASDSSVDVLIPAQTDESIEKREAQGQSVEEDELPEPIGEEKDFSSSGNVTRDKIETGKTDNITAPIVNEEIKEKRQTNTQDQEVQDSSSSNSNIASDKVNVLVPTNVNDEISAKKRDTQDQESQDSSSQSDNIGSDKVQVGVMTNVNDNISAKKRDTQDQAVEDSGTSEGNMASDQVNVLIPTNVNDNIGAKKRDTQGQSVEDGSSQSGNVGSDKVTVGVQTNVNDNISAKKRDTQDQAVQDSGTSEGNIASDQVYVLVPTNVNDNITGVEKRDTQDQAVADSSSSKGDIGSDRVSVVVATNVNDNITGVGQGNTHDQSVDESSSDGEESSGGSQEQEVESSGGSQEQADESSGGSQEQADESSGGSQEQAVAYSSSRYGDIASDRVNVLVATNVNDRIHKRDTEVAQEEVVPNTAESNNATALNTNTTADTNTDVVNPQALDASEESKEKRETEDIPKNQTVLNTDESEVAVSNTNMTAEVNETNTHVATITNEHTKEKRQIGVQDPIVQYIQPIMPEVFVENPGQGDEEIFENDGLGNAEIIYTGREARLAPYITQEETTTEVSTTEVSTTEVVTETTEEYNHGQYWQQESQKVYEDITKQAEQGVVDNLKSIFF